MEELFFEIAHIIMIVGVQLPTGKGTAGRGGGGGGFDMFWVEKKTELKMQ